MEEIEIPSLDAKRFESVLDKRQSEEFAACLRAATVQLDGYTYWQINSTAAGGGVAEMLQSVLSYLRGGGVNTRWAVIDGDHEFFVVTKRIHNFLHGSEGDGGALAKSERTAYELTLRRQFKELETLVQPGDVVVLHDPQTLGFAPHLRELGASVIWSCHVGIDSPNTFAHQAWEFLAPYAHCAQRAVFSRPSYAWDQLDPTLVAVIPPCIDAFSPKNQPLEMDTVAAILDKAGVVPNGSSARASFRRQNGDEAVVAARAVMLEEAPVPAGAKLVTQISRWDPLKDHLGVMVGFCEYVPENLGAHVVLVGPSPESVTDDPEGGVTLDELRAAWDQLPGACRERVHIACLPMDDLEENAAIVNALQRRADVIVQKSLAEGFGLTVAEAMWKETPTVASAVGGIQDQINNGVNGLLIEPHDLEEFGRAVTGLLEDPDFAKELGRAAHVSVRDHYLAPHYLASFLDLAMSVR
ncbi:MAG TPA: glycosyltransferase [Acidimicrobiales bacterium]|jgi:trehalose synthase